MVDKDELKNNLTLDDIYELLNFLKGEPRQENDNTIICRTICHNKEPLEGSHKLYYYNNTKLFHCYTSCSESFDVYELICKRHQLETNIKWTISDAIFYLANFFHLDINNAIINEIDSCILKDWDVLSRYKTENINLNHNFNLTYYDTRILHFFPQPIIEPWEQEGISREVMKHRGIAYNPLSNGIIIPHYDKDNNLIGIRERTLIRSEEKKAKYHPTYFKKNMYNHPLAFNLYNLNWSKNNITKIKKAIVFESEKSCLKYASYFGEDNDISVAVCGSNIFINQIFSLISIGVSEVIIALDKQFQVIGDIEWQRLTKKLMSINDKYKPYVQISFLFDKNDLLEYKDSPIDKTKEIFLQLLQERIEI